MVLLLRMMIVSLAILAMPSTSVAQYFRLNDTCLWPDAATTPFTRGVVENAWKCTQELVKDGDGDFSTYWTKKAHIFVPLIEIDEALRQGNVDKANAIVDAKINPIASMKGTLREESSTEFYMAPHFVDDKSSYYTLTLGMLDDDTIGLRLIPDDFVKAESELRYRAWEDQAKTKQLLEMIQKHFQSDDAIAETCRFLKWPGAVNCYCEEAAFEAYNCPLRKAYAVRYGAMTETNVYVFRSGVLSLIPWTGNSASATEPELTPPSPTTTEQASQSSEVKQRAIDPDTIPAMESPSSLNSIPQVNPAGLAGEPIIQDEPLGGAAIQTKSSAQSATGGEFVNDRMPESFSSSFFLIGGGVGGLFLVCACLIYAVLKLRASRRIVDKAA